MKEEIRQVITGARARSINITAIELSASAYQQLFFELLPDRFTDHAFISGDKLVFHGVSVSAKECTCGALK